MGASPRAADRADGRGGDALEETSQRVAGARAVNSVNLLKFGVTWKALIFLSIQYSIKPKRLTVGFWRMHHRSYLLSMDHHRHRGTLPPIVSVRPEISLSLHAVRNQPSNIPEITPQVPPSRS